MAMATTSRSPRPLAWKRTRVALGSLGRCCSCSCWLLCLRRKLSGALLIALAGAALLVLTVVCAVAAVRAGPAERAIIGYYAVFWAPAGIASVLAGAVMLRPLAAVLRQPS